MVLGDTIADYRTRFDRWPLRKSASQSGMAIDCLNSLSSQNEIGVNQLDLLHQVSEFDTFAIGASLLDEIASR